MFDLISSLQPIPLLAEWKTSSSDNTIVFTLLDKKFHDGTTLTSKDVIKCLVEGRSRGSNVISQVLDFNEISSKKIMFKLRDNNFLSFLNNISTIEGVIFKRDRSNNFIGTGPYKINKIDKKRGLFRKDFSKAIF